MVKLGVAIKCFPAKLQTTTKGMDERTDCYLRVVHIAPSQDETLSQNNKCDVFSENKRSCFITIVLFFSVAVNVVLTVLYLTRLSESEAAKAGLTSSDDVNGSNVCVVCSSLGIAGDDDAYAYDVVAVGDTHMCCVRNSEHILKLVMVLSHLYSDAEERRGVNVTDPTVFPRGDNSAHLYLDSTRPTDEPRMVWTDEYGWGAAYIGNGVTYSNGSLIIKEDGRYYVYSFLTTKYRSTTENQNLVHAVYRRNAKLQNTGKMVLLIGKQSLSTGEESLQTSYLGACVVLRAGDQLTVQLNPQSAVYTYAPANYFGLFKLDE